MLGVQCSAGQTLCEGAIFPQDPSPATHPQPCRFGTVFPVVHTLYDYD